MQLLMSIFLLMISFNALGVCMTELDGELYGCKRLYGKDGEWFCNTKYGSEYKAYYTTNTCDKDLAYSLRGQTYKETKYNQGPEIKAACMTYETGKKRGCELYDYSKAEVYCAENFGTRYVAFMITDKCSEEYASESRGEIKHEKLIENLESPMVEIEKMMTMLDRQGVNSSLGEFISKKPIIGNEFYTSVIKSIMARMNDVKKELLKRSHYNVTFNTPSSAEFVGIAFRYINLHSRLHKIYAFVAHKNNNALKSYKFENLAYLNLVLRKNFGLEMMAKVNYMSRTVNNGEDIEFEIGEQEKQTFEYEAMSDPDNHIDYAKLITYLGVRVNVTNLWAVQRLSHRDILSSNKPVNSCGKGFLSFRPGAGGYMQKSEAITELQDFDVFTTEYSERIKYLSELSMMTNILDTEQKAVEVVLDVINKIPEVKKFLASNIDQPLRTTDQIRRYAKEYTKAVMESEVHAWKYFSENMFSTIIMPGDDIQNKNFIINRISSDAYRFRVRAIVEALSGLFVWLKDDTISKIAKQIEKTINDYYKADFFKRSKDVLVSGFHNYNDHSTMVNRNLNNKVEETLTSSYLGVRAMYVGDKIQDEKKLMPHERLEPIDLEELVSFFHSKIDQEYYDVRKTMEKDPEMAKIVTGFFEKIAVYYDYNYAKYAQWMENLDQKTAVRKVMIDWNIKFKEALRDSAIRAAYDLHNDYPFILANQFAIGADNYVERDQSVNMSRRGALSNEDLAALFNEGLENRPYVNRGLNPGNYQGLSSIYRPNYSIVTSTNYGNNPDGITAGTVGRPMGLSESGMIKTPNGMDQVDNNELWWLVSQNPIISEKMKKAMESKKTKVLKYTDNSRVKLITDKRTFLFRVFHALNLDFVALDSTKVNYFGTFAPADKDQLIMANKRLNQVYQTQAILRNEVKWGKKPVPLLLQIAKNAFNPWDGKIDEWKAKGYIKQAITAAIKEVPEKLNKFCKADYIYYKSSPDFKDSFKASKYLRATVQNPTGSSKVRSQKYEKFDAKIVKDIRSDWEAMNDDYFEPIVMITGAAALVALVVVFSVGTGGVGAPAALAGLYTVCSAFLAVEFIASAPFVAASLYSRINTHFIETPQQLKFQRSLAVSQLDNKKVVDWELLNQDEHQNKKDRMYTAAFSSLDFLYGYSLFRHVKSKVGFSALSSYRKLTGVRMKVWSAPPASMLAKASFTELRRKHGVFKAIYTSARQAGARAISYAPRYQPLSDLLIRSAPLRSGISRMAQKIGIHNKPWALAPDITKYLDSLKKRVTTYDGYVKKEGELFEKLGLLKKAQDGSEVILSGPQKLTSRFRWRDIKQHGFEFATAKFLPASMLKVFKEAMNGNPKLMVEFFRNFGKVWNELKHVQGKLVHDRIQNIQKVLDKINDYQATVRANGTVNNSANHMDEMLKLLSDDEILVLQEVANYQKGTIRNFKSVFKHHNELVENLRPIEYLYGNVGVKFSNVLYPQNIFMGERITGYNPFVGNHKEDLRKFYEDMVRQNSYMSDSHDKLVRKIEEEFSRIFKTTSTGELETIK